MTIKETKQDINLHHRSSFRRQLFLIFFMSLIVGAILDSMHYSWMTYPWTKQVIVMGFTVSVPVAILALLLFATMIRPRGKWGCFFLCLFSLPVSVVAMSLTYSTAIQRYNLSSETGMAIVFGIIPAVIIGLIFALWIYFTYKANSSTKNAKNC